MRKLILSLGLATLAAPVAWASDDHSGHSMSSHDGMDGIHAEATIHTIDGDTVNLTHGPIAEIGWPVTISASTTPTMASGTVSMISRGWCRLSKLEAITT